MVCPARRLGRVPRSVLAPCHGLPLQTPLRRFGFRACNKAQQGMSSNNLWRATVVQGDGSSLPSGTRVIWRPRRLHSCAMLDWRRNLRGDPSRMSRLTIRVGGDCYAWTWRVRPDDRCRRFQLRSRGTGWEGSALTPRARRTMSDSRIRLARICQQRGAPDRRPARVEWEPVRPMGGRGAIAQYGRAPGSHPGGRRFEPG